MKSICMNISSTPLVAFAKDIKIKNKPCISFILIAVFLFSQNFIAGETKSSSPAFVIKYGSFEKDYGEYFNSGHYKNSVQRTKGNAFSGKYAVKVGLNEFPGYLALKKWGRGWLYSGIEKIINKSADYFYIEYYVNFNYTSGTRRIRNIADYYDENKKHLPKLRKILETTASKPNVWQRKTVKFKIPEEAHYVRFTLNSEGGKGEFYLIDDIVTYKPDVKRKRNIASIIDDRLLLYVPFRKNLSVKLDGEINEKEWNRIKWVEGFLDYKTGAPADHKTRFKVLRSKDGLYLAVFAEGAKPAAAVKRNQDAGIFSDDVVEIFIGSSQFDHTYRHLVFNSLGYNYSSIAQKVAPVKWEVKTKITSGGYYAEVYIPFSSLGSKIERIINFNIGRESRLTGKKRSIASWSGVQQRFHKFIDFGQIILGEGGGQTPGSPNISIDVQEKKIKLNFDENFNIADTSCWLHYCQATGFEKYKYIKLPFIPGKDKKTVVPINERMDTGLYFVTVIKENQHDIKGVNICRFSFHKLRKARIAFAHPVIIPSPKKECWKQDVFDLHKVKNVIYYPSTGGYEQKTAEKIKKYLAPYGVRICSIRKGAGASPATGDIILGSLKNAAFTLFLDKYNKKMLDDVKSIKSKSQGYAMKLCNNGIAVLAGQDGAGAYYAFITFLQTVRFNPDNVPQVSIIDWPDHQKRSMTDLNLFYNLRESSFELSKRFVFDNLAFTKYNELIICVSRNTLELCEGENKKLNYKKGRKQVYPNVNMKKLVLFGKENFIRLYPMWEKPDQIIAAYPELKEFPSSTDSWNRRVVCTRNPKYYKILFPVLKEVYEIFDKPEVFHIGHDEVRYHPAADDIWSCKLCGKATKNELFMNDVIKQAEYLKSLGVKEVRMWSDMLIESWGGGHTPYNIKETIAMRNRLAKEYPYIVPAHWNRPKGSGSHVKPLFQSKFKKIAWSQTFPVVNEDIADDMSVFSAIGMNRTGGLFPWVSWMPRNNYGEAKKIGNKPEVPKGRAYRHHPVIYRTADLLWNCNTRDKWTDYEEFPFAKGNAMCRYTSARPVGSSVQFKAVVINGRDDPCKVWNLPGKGFNFNIIKKDIAASFYKDLFNDGRAVLLRKDKDKMDISIGTKTKMIAVLHTMTIPDGKYEAFAKKVQQELNDKPRLFEEGKKIGEYVIRYTDGSENETSINLGFNIFFYTHYLFGHHLPLWDASEVWVVSGNPPLSAYVYVIINPEPDKEIDAVSLIKTEDATEIAVFAAAVAQ